MATKSSQYRRRGERLKKEYIKKLKTAPTQQDYLLPFGLS